MSGGIASPAGGLGFRIERIWAFLAVHEDGDEGLCGAPLPGTPYPMPMIAADGDRLNSLIPIATDLSTMFDGSIELARFDRRTNIEIFDGGSRREI